MNNKYMVISKKHNCCVWYMTGKNQVSCEAEHSIIFPDYESALAFKMDHILDVRKDLILIALPHSI